MGRAREASQRAPLQGALRSPRLRVVTAPPPREEEEQHCLETEPVIDAFHMRSDM